MTQSRTSSAQPRARCRVLSPSLRKRIAVFSLLLLGLVLAFLLTRHDAPSASAGSMRHEPIRQTYEAYERLPYASLIQKHAAHEAARALARISVARQVSGTITSITAIRFGIDQKQFLPAVILTALPFVEASFSNDSEAVRIAGVNCFIPPKKLTDLVQLALLREDEIELKAEALLRMEPLALEAKTLLERAASTADEIRLFPVETPSENTLRKLGAQLESYNRYIDALELFGSNWAMPHEAVEMLHDLAEKAPDNALVATAFAETLLRLDRPHEALALMNDVLVRAPQRARALYVRGMTQLRLQLPALAIADLSVALYLRSDKAAWWEARGAAFMVQGEYPAMCNDLNQACTLGECAGLAEAFKQGLCAAQWP